MVPVEVSDPAMLAAIYRLRVTAWRARAPHFPDIDAWSDAYDAQATHWAVIEDGQPVAAARLTVHLRMADVPNSEIYNLQGPIAVLTRLVVAPAYAAKGLPRLLDLARLEAARAASCRHAVIECYAHIPRARAVEALGFLPMGASKAYASGPLIDVKIGRGGGEEVYLLQLNP